MVSHLYQPSLLLQPLLLLWLTPALVMVVATLPGAWSLRRPHARLSTACCRTLMTTRPTSSAWRGPPASFRRTLGVRSCQPFRACQCCALITIAASKTNLLGHWYSCPNWGESSYTV
jgi:hypothetical protein